MNLKILNLLVLATVTALAVRADEPQPQPQRLTETPEQYTQRMKWFGEARFGMFIHWGVYSVPAGEFDGGTNYGEWILESVNREDQKAGHAYRLPVSKYEKFADEFNPVKFNAREWAHLAKQAGMKYLVITSKHHDGFDMWPSQVGDWNIGRTPFKRDPLKELSEACHVEGIQFCLYHSIMDWHQPDYGIRRPWNDLATNPPNMDRYMVYLKSQLQEIITHYGPLGILWFDGEWEDVWTTDRGIEIYNYIRGLQPNLIVNNRVGRARAGMSGMNKGAGVGDYGTPEQEIPATGFGPGVYWESCMTMNDHWGYNKHDQNFKSTSELVHNLIDCASKGGNYLLNVGPTSEGLFPAASVERLKQIGEWMHANSESIYATEAGPLGHLPWGRCTQKTQGSRTTLYLHVFDWPSDGKLVVPGLLSAPNSARLLVTGKKLHTSNTADGIVIEVPQDAPDKISTTVVLRIKGKVQVADTQH